MAAEGGYPSLSHGTRAFPLPTISEDTLHCVLHPAPGELGSEADAAALATLISSYVTSLLTQPWLWNKDPWELKVDGGKLAGTMRVGDAVDDEWLVVWLLREVSRRWPQLAISIRDSDGEFLLIEAAHELPAWVSPENSDNRLWLYGGHLNLLPLSVRSASRPKQIADTDYDDSGRAVDADAYLSEEDALSALRTGKYRAPEGVENAVWERISCYPAALKTHQHYAKAYLPVPVARALKADPALVQRAVEGFYVRDPAQLRAASRMTHFPPTPTVLSSVLMTRAAYAQLQGQVFHPPRVFGNEWHVREEQGEAERRWRDLGVKIATGFEIMYREGGRKGRVADAESTPDDLAKDPAYTKYIADLKSAGFFGDELQGSAKWKEREAQAAKGWIEARSSDTTQQRPSFAYLVDKAIDETKDIPTDALGVTPDSHEDSDKWLEVDPDELDAMMMRASGGKAQSGQDVKLGDEHGEALKDLAGKLEAFIGGEGDLQGAQFADELSDMDTDSEDDDAAKPTAAEREERMRNLVPGLSAEEWGRRDTGGDRDVEMDAAPDSGSGQRKGTVAGSAFGDSMLPPKMRPPMFAKQEFDGVESDTSDEDEDDLPPRGTLGRKIADMKWGNSPPREAHIEELSDDEGGDEEDRADRARAKALKLDDDIDEQMRQRVWGDGGPDAAPGAGQAEEAGEGMDVDMENEQADFINFAREALGVDDKMWEDILKSRRERGAYVPSESKGKGTSTTASTKPKQPDQSLNSFESMMAAMEGELARHGGPQPAPSAGKSEASAPSQPSKLQSLASLPTEAEVEDMDDDALAAMDQELRAALKESGADTLGSDDDDVPEASQLEGDAAERYRMIRNLLESYRSQGGDAGAAGNLLGRLAEEKKK